MQPQHDNDENGPSGGGHGTPPRERAFNIPPFLVALVVVFIAIHGLVYYGPNPIGTQLFLNLAFFPVRLLASDAALAQFFAGPSWLSYFTLATYGLLHGSWLHLGVNALWLVTFGAPVVRRLGPQRFLALLVLGTIAGALTHLLIYWGSAAPLVGASAGVSAIMGGAARFVFDSRDRGMMIAVRNPELVRHRPVQSLREVWSNPTVLVFCGMLIVSNLLFGAVSVPGAGEGSSIAWQAHIGGFALGFFGFTLFDVPRAARPRD
ncbi:MAG: rhomboid family intramembrane serine protease [Devosiaceae bacterium]